MTVMGGGSSHHDHTAAPRYDTSGIDARILNETTTKEDVRWLVESVETLTAERDRWEHRAWNAERRRNEIMGAVEDYLLWEPGKAGHVEAQRRLRAALQGASGA